ncbi:MAG: hypothetical protein IJA15_01085 [Clostridia bacterium]|nr:hypothetical protein [Clostridia bacterium]
MGKLRKRIDCVGLIMYNKLKKRLGEKMKNNKQSYYEFDDKNREVVFKRYDMPSPWMNFLTNGEFFTMISQAGGNLSWYKSPEIWRIGRYPFYLLPTDENGLFVYIKDLKTGKVWNPNFLPSRESLDFFESRHGLGYTKFIAKKDGVKAVVTAYVGKENALIYKLDITSEDNRKVQIFTAKEMANMEYLREVQWEYYTRNSNNITYNKQKDALVYDYFIDAQARPDETPYVFFTATKKSSSYTAVRKDFCGFYRGLNNPIAIENGACPNTELYGGESIFAFSYDLDITPTTQSIYFTLGTVNKKADVDGYIEKFKHADFVEGEFAYLQAKWEEKLSRFKLTSGDEQFDRMANIWNPYQVYNTFYICREISYYATGTIRGMGVRDASQDALSNVIYDVESAKERIKDIMLEQYQEGKTNHYYYHIEKRPSMVSDRSDNHLWMIYTVYEIIMETGDLSILDEVVPYYDGGEGTVFEHLTKSIEFSMSHLGKDNIPLMLGSDWNDCLDTVCRKGKGESVMVAEQVVLGARMMIELCKLKGVDYSYFESVYHNQKDTINNSMYDGDRYVRAVTDGGVRLGEKSQECGKIWLNSNTWAVLSGVADAERGNACMDNVMKYLNSDIGLVKQYPALKLNYPTPEEQISWATPGISENGGVFCHANTWAIMAYCMLNRGNDAYKIYSELIPDNVISKVGVERYITEPYIYSSNIRALYAPRGGEAAVSWVTGTSIWMNISIQQYICGIKPKYDALEIKPCLPDHIKHATIQRKFRNSTYTIEVFNNGGGKIEKITVNGIEQADYLVKPTQSEIKVVVYM